MPSHDILIEDGGAATTCSNNNSAAHMNLGIFWPMQRAGRKSGKVHQKTDNKRDQLYWVRLGEAFKRLFKKLKLLKLKLRLLRSAI